MSYGSIEFEVSETTLDGDVTRVAVKGELDIDTARQLQERLDEMGENEGQAVVLDLAECLFLDSIGLATILRAARNLQARGGGLKIVCTRPNILRLFELTTLNQTLPVYDSVPEALADGRGA
jgi:anti-sigma B factor antagonist